VRVIVGLGNPGSEYEGSRHNVGFIVVAGLADGCGIRLSAGRGDFMSGSGRLAGEHVTLVMPLTFMNASGRAVAQVLDQRGATPSDLLVICDDVDLPLGQLRLRRSGGYGGHRGLSSIIDSLGTDEFARLRVGVGRPPAGDETADFVLNAFADDEGQTVDEMVERAGQAVRVLVKDGIDRAMTVFNRKIDASPGTGEQEG
jgi:PTH1 family peptidyl-tRNA hydrolase